MYYKLERMLLYVFKQIEKSQNPEANMKWFVSEEAKEWYKNYKKQNPKEDNWVDEVFEQKS